MNIKKDLLDVYQTILSLLIPFWFILLSPFAIFVIIFLWSSDYDFTHSIIPSPNITLSILTLITIYVLLSVTMVHHIDLPKKYHTVKNLQSKIIFW